MTIKISSENQTMEECRQRSDHYWKIIEKQRYYIQNLLKLVVQVSNENEALVKKNRKLEGYSISSTETPPYSDTMQQVKDLLSQANSLEHSVSPNMSPVPPPRSPYRVNGGTSPLTENTLQPTVSLPKRPPALKLTMSNHSPLHLRSAQETDILTRDYLISPHHPAHHHTPSTFHSPTAITSLDLSRMTYKSDSIISPKRGTSSKKFNHQNSSKEEQQSQKQQHLDGTISRPSIDLDTDRDSENFSLIDAYVRNSDVPEKVHRKSLSEPSTPMKVRTPRYDSLAQNNSGNGDNPLDSAVERMKILNNFANISINLTQPVHKSRISPTFSITICRQVRGERDYPLWTVEKQLSDFDHLDVNLKRNPVIASKLNKLTDTSVFSSRAFSKAEDQVTAIEKYLQHVISLRLIDSSCICKFLCSESVESVDINPDLVQGYLRKHRKNSGGRKRKYFVLEREFLKYYESKEGAFLGMIHLSNSQISEYASIDYETGTRRYGFVILEQRKLASSRLYRHTLFADSVFEREIWINALRNTDAIFINDSNKYILSEPKLLDNFNLEPSSSTESIKIATVPKRPSMEYIFSYFNGPGGRRRSSSAIKEPPSVPSTPDATSLSNNNSSNNDDDSGDAKKQKSRSTRRTFWEKKRTNCKNELLPSTSPSCTNMLLSIDGIYPYNEEEETNGYAKVFSISLKTVVSISQIYNNYQLPSIVYRCIEYIEEKSGLIEEGIYRLSGSALKLRLLRKIFNEEGDLDLIADKEDHDVHTIAGLLKMWLRELPESVLTETLLKHFLQSLKLNEKDERINYLSRLISQLPLVNYTLLRTLCSHLIRVIQNSSQNKMTLRNIVIVFSATLAIHSGIFSLFLTEFECIFSTLRYQDCITPQQRGTEIQTAEIPDEQTASVPTNIKINDYKYSNRNSFHYRDHAPKNTIDLESLLEDNPISFDDDEDSVYEDEFYFSEGELGVAYLAHRQNANSNSTVYN